MIEDFQNRTEATGRGELEICRDGDVRVRLGNESCLPDGVGRFFIADDFLIATQDSLEIATKVAIQVSKKQAS